MAQGPESRLWQSLKRSMPKTWTAHRIENRSGGGLPDVFVNADGLPFWVELKVINLTRVKISPHQIAWHFSFFRNKGLSFFLVQDPRSRFIHALRGCESRNLASKPLLENDIFGSYKDRAEMWSDLGAAARDHYISIFEN